jgi:ATP-dependent exoDNAse (exonuclease V) beta subunit
VEADGARDRARRLGIAFHEAMERADLAAGPPVRERVDEAAARQKLDRAAAGELEAMLAATFGSTLFERIRTALVGGAAVHRELPFVRLAGESGALEEGKIDLLIREAAGWVIVDYKTDRTPAGVADVAGHFRERYGAQIAAYGAALAEAGIPVRAGYLLLARSGAVVEVPLDRDGWRRGASGTLRPSAEPARAERAELDSRRQERTIQRPLPFDDRE